MSGRFVRTALAGLTALTVAALLGCGGGDDTAGGSAPSTGTGSAGVTGGVTVFAAASLTESFTRIGNLWTSGTSGSQSLEFNQTTGTLVIVPEPAALALAGLGIAVAAWARRRRS